MNNETNWTNLMNELRTTVDAFLQTEVIPQMEQIHFKKLKITYVPTEDDEFVTYTATVAAHHEMVWWLASTLCTKLCNSLKHVSVVDPNVKRISLATSWNARENCLNDTQINVYRTE